MTKIDIILASTKVLAELDIARSLALAVRELREADGERWNVEGRTSVTNANARWRRAHRAVLAYDEEEKPWVTYGDDGAAFSRACPSCGRFVKPDGEIRFNEETGPKQERNATCSRCGRVEMDFVGYVEVGP